MFLTRVWANGIIGVLEAKVLSGCGRNPVSQMTATGVPPTLVLANQMEALTEKVSELEESSVKRHEEFVQTVTEKFDQIAGEYFIPYQSYFGNHRSCGSNSW